MPRKKIDKTLDEMSREERFEYMKSKLSTSARFKLSFQSFSNEEKSLFIEEYLSVIKSTDSITEAEEQSLFAAILELILSFQALNRKEIQEKLYHETLEGIYKKGDSKFTPSLNNAEKYGKEYETHMSLYQKGITQLNMARRDRVKNIKTERKTLVDLAEELSNKGNRMMAAEEIERLNRLQDEELKRLIKEGHLMGKFV